MSQEIWITPTPIPMSVNTPVFNDLIGMEQEVAVNLVQGYHQANLFGAMDILYLLLMLFLVIGGIWSIIKHAQKVL